MSRGASATAVNDDPAFAADVPRRSFLGRVAPEDRTRLAAVAIRRVVLDAAVLRRQGDPAPTLLVVLDGLVRESHIAVDGTETILHCHGPGDVLSAAEVTAGLASLTSLHSLSPCALLEVPAGELPRLLRAAPTIALALVGVLGERVRAAEDHRLNVATAGARSLVCHWLLELARHDGWAWPSSRAVTIRCTQSELAAWAGLSREAVVKHLRALREDGLVATERQRLTVLDPVRLAQAEHAET